MHFIRKRLSTEKNKTLKAEPSKQKNVSEAPIAQESKPNNTKSFTASPKSKLSASKESRLVRILFFKLFIILNL